MTNILKFIKGYVVIRLGGYAPERFLNLCSHHHIILWGMRSVGTEYEMCVSIGGFRRLRPLVRKTRTKVVILERHGLPFILHRYRNRKLFAAGAVAGAVLLYVMSLFIWNIHIEGNYSLSDPVVLGYLENIGIVHGMKKKDVHGEQIEEMLREYFPEITWAAARISGTRLLISVKENEALSQIPEKQETPCDVVASKDGIISSIVVRQGIAQVKAGDTVKEGQVLISGEIPIYDDSGQVAAVRYVPADGDVTAVTRYDFSEQFPRIHTVQWETGRRKTGFYLQAGPWSFVFLLPEGGKEQWVYLTETSQARLFSNFYLPVYWGEIQGKEVEYYESFYTESEMEQVSEGIYQNFVKNLNEKGVQIIQNDVKILEDESVCRMEGTVTALESVTRIQEITELKETENLEYERSGEYH